jgi:hypothetical protein
MIQSEYEDVKRESAQKADFPGFFADSGTFLAVRSPKTLEIANVLVVNLLASRVTQKPFRAAIEIWNLG